MLLRIVGGCDTHTFGVLSLGLAELEPSRDLGPDVDDVILTCELVPRGLAGFGGEEALADRRWVGRFAPTARSLPLSEIPACGAETVFRTFALVEGGQRLHHFRRM